MNWLGWGVAASGLSAAYFWKQLHPGESLNPTPLAAHGEAMSLKDVQHTLNCLLGAHLTEDGNEGPDTVNAIKCFQARVGLQPDGKCGPRTLHMLKKTVERMRLHALPVQAGFGADPTDSVQWVQHALNLLGRCKLKEDGRLGPKTVQCIKAFQKSCGLAPDGRVGHLTLGALKHGVAKKRMHAHGEWVEVVEVEPTIGLCAGFG